MYPAGSRTGWIRMKSDGNGYFWNAAAGLLNAGEAVILSMVVTRTSGLADAGVLSMAFAAGNLMMSIGKFGVRSYQVTDVAGDFSFSDYFWVRVVSVILMIAASLIYIFYCIHVKGYSSEKAAIVFAFCFIYAVEAMEDVFWGLYQQKQALDTGAKLFILRWLAILGICILVLVLFRDLCLASVFGAAVSLAIFCISNSLVFWKFREKVLRIRLGAVKEVLCQCFSLFIASFMTIYVTNAPKYAIDRYLTEEVQACYGFIAMPVFVIGLLNGFLYQPSLVQMALEWKECRIDSFRRRIRRQCVVLLGLTVICLLGAYLCGIPVLSAIYGTDLSGYKKELLVLLCGGGMFAYAGYFSVLLTIMRKQEMVMDGYAAVSVLSLIFSNRLVRSYGMGGAVVLYALLMGMLAMVFAFVYRKEIKMHVSKIKAKKYDKR